MLKGGLKYYASCLRRQGNRAMLFEIINDSVDETLYKGFIEFTDGANAT